MKGFFFFLVVGFLLFQNGQSKTFTEADLAKELYRQGFPLSELNNWYCLVMGESSGNTAAMNTNKNGSKDYGLFQINNHIWCGGSYKGNNECKVTCEVLNTDDITEACKCAKIIKKQQGWTAWNAWKSKCQGKTLKDVTKWVK